MRRLLIASLILICTSAFGQTYRWIDSSGRTVFSDTPPPGKTQGVAKTEEAASSGDNLPFAVKRAMEKFPVTLYTDPENTNESKQARDLLNSRGIPFTEKVLKTEQDVDELKKLIGDSFVPTLKVGTQTSRGLNAAGYNNLLDLAGYPKTAPYGSKPAGGSGK